MNKKWMPITAGVLDILFGVFGALYGTVVLIFGPLLYASKDADYEIWGPLYFLIGVLTIVGSIFSLKIKRWRLALTGAISACLFLTIYLVTDFVYRFDIVSQMNKYGNYNRFSYINWGDIVILLPIVAAILAMVLIIKSRNQFKKL